MKRQQQRVRTYKLQRKKEKRRKRSNQWREGDGKEWVKCSRLLSSVFDTSAVPLCVRYFASISSYIVQHMVSIMLVPAISKVFFLTGTKGKCAFSVLRLYIAPLL